MQLLASRVVAAKAGGSYRLYPRILAPVLDIGLPATSRRFFFCIILNIIVGGLVPALMGGWKVVVGQNREERAGEVVGRPERWPVATPGHPPVTQPSYAPYNLPPKKITNNCSV